MSWSEESIACIFGNNGGWFRMGIQFPWRHVICQVNIPKKSLVTV